VREAFEGQAGIEGGIVGVGRAGIGDLLGASRPPVLPEPPKPKHPPELVHVSGGVQAAKLIYKVQPIYPELAIRSRVSAVVVLEVKVDEEGNVSEVIVLKGHPLFDEAAVKAVRQWKYSPTLLNGEPVPVMASVTVIFKLR